MTLDDFLQALDALDANAPLIFATEAGPIAGGYHVTEFKLAQVESIDCGGRRSRFDEAVLQLLDGRGGHNGRGGNDGQGGARMTVGKFAEIARRSTIALPGLGSAPLKVEFAHGNAGKSIFEPGTPSAEVADAAGVYEGVYVALAGESALCKPAVAAMAAATAAGVPEPSLSGTCCGPAKAKASCC